MTRSSIFRSALFVVGIVLVGFTTSETRGDWPQWRGPNRDARATDFKAPKTWPKELTQKWKVTVGDGVATPALVGDKLFVFSREGNSEVTRCLEVSSGKEVWKDKYDAEFKAGGDKGYPGPRSSPAVANDRVITFGVNGTLSCLNANTGAKVWRIETGARPQFHTSSSPLIVDKAIIIQVGSENSGGISAYDLDKGEVKWKWTEDGSSYSSPVLMKTDSTETIVAEMNKNVVAINLQDGKTLWKTAFPVPGSRNYNASTPMVDGQTVIFSGSNRGTKAIKVEKKGDAFSTKELWSNKENAVMYNSPVIKNGHVFGLASNDTLFCVNAETGKTAWTHTLTGRRGYGNIVDAGTVLMVITPASPLIVFEPSEKEFTEVASYKNVGTDVYAYPIVSGNRIFIKDKTSVTLWTVE